MSPGLLLARRERARLLAEALQAETGIPAECILGRERDPQVVTQRHRLWMMLIDSGLSQSAVAQVLGFDPTSILYAVRKNRQRAAQVST